MKIVQLTASNVKRLKAVDVTMTHAEMRTVADLLAGEQR